MLRLELANSSLSDYLFPLSQFGPLSQDHPLDNMSFTNRVPRKLSLPELENLFLQMAQALEAVHQFRILHGEISLDNFACFFSSPVENVWENEI